MEFHSVAGTFMRENGLQSKRVHTTPLPGHSGNRRLAFASTETMMLLLLSSRFPLLQDVVRTLF
jgi:hypothetical protein